MAFSDYLQLGILIALLLIWGELRALRANLFAYAKAALSGDWANHLRIP